MPGLTYDDIKDFIKALTDIEWLELWKQQNTELDQINPSTLRWKNPDIRRNVEIEINRLRIGHNPPTIMASLWKRKNLLTTKYVE